MKIEVVAEAGVGHGGNVDVALKMIDSAKAAGADVVKFQTYSPEAAINPKHKDFAFLKSLALPNADFLKLARHCEEVHIEFLSTPGDVDSLKFLYEECGVKRIKIGSDDLTFVPLLKGASKTNLPIILSTGMSTLDEVMKAWAYLDYRPVTFLHCVSLYPCPLDKANLLVIPKLQRLFPFVGYSDHCQGVLACIVAASMGVILIEKHFELRDYRGPDHDVSINEFMLAKMVARIREIELLLGSGVREISPEEKANIPLFRKQADGMKMA